MSREQLLIAVGGARLTEADAKALEVAVAGNPADVTSRLKLLGYYQRPRISDPIARDRRANHVLWFSELLRIT